MAKIPSTPALRLLRDTDVAHTLHPYRYQGGGTGGFTEATGIDEHTVIKTLVFDGDAGPTIVLMHGDREVSVRALARHLGVKHMEPASPAAAERVTGYRVGGISPFGTRQVLPVVVQASVLDLPRVHVNAGSRGLLVGIDPAAFVDVLGATTADVAT